jgi:predicted ATPase/DNA-binding XRE family transcriptional regulator
MNSEASFGSWLKQRRKQLDLTQAMLAEQVGCAAETLRKIEAGRLRPSRQVASRLAECLQIPPAERDAFVQAARGTFALPASTVSHPTPATASTARFRLPAPLTPLIGREAELAALDALLASDATRLITLVGPPGIGKTRLALALAAEHQHRYANGAVFVDLAPLHDAELVAGTIATTLGLREDGRQPPLERLTQFLAARHLLLVLDNYEHVLGAAPLVTTLLRAAPGLRALATSRVPLHLSGEQRYAVPPLALPDAQVAPTVAVVASSAAVQLFVARARAVRHTFTLTQANAAAVAEICRRLDGLPLAIELAAAQIARFEPHAVLAQLDPLLPLLGDGPRDAPDRQRTLRRAVAWSYSLLSAEGQRLFRQLGVFVGGWTLDAAEAVCDTGAGASLAVLEEHSLLRRSERGVARFTMLEMVREFALEQLRTAGEAEGITAQHADYFLVLAEEAEPQLRGPQQAAWLDTLDAEHDNLRAALTWTTEHNHELGLRLAAALAFFWDTRGHLSEGSRWLANILEHAGEPTSPSRAKALCAAAELAWNRSDYKQAETLGEQSLQIYRFLEDSRGMGLACKRLGETARALRDYDRATVFFEQGLALLRDAGDPLGEAEALCEFGFVIWRQSDYPRAQTMFERSLQLYEELGYQTGVALALMGLGVIAEVQGEYERWADRSEQCLRIYQALGDKRGIAAMLRDLGDIALEHGDYERAHSLLDASMDVFREAGSKRSLGGSFMLYGRLAWAQGDNDTARAYYEQSAALLEEVGDQLYLATLLNYRGQLAWFEGELDVAFACSTQAAALAAKVEFKPELARALCGLGKLACQRAEYDTAHISLRESLAIRRTLGHRRDIADTLDVLAMLAEAHDTLQHAMRLCGAAEALRQVARTPLHPPEALERDRLLVQIRVALVAGAAAHVWDAGRRMTPEEAVACAATLSLSGGSALSTAPPLPRPRSR